MKKTDPNECDKDKRTCLHYASAQGHAEIVAHLLSMASMKPNIQDDDGRTALYKACECDHYNIVRLLTENHTSIAKVDCNIADKDGNTPLHACVAKENAEIAALLVSAGADPNLKNNDGHTPLMLAVQRNSLDFVEFITSENADTGIADNEKRSPLMIAVKSNNISIVKCLLSLFPDTSLSDKHGWTAIDFAQINVDNTCLRLLEDHEKRCDNPDYDPEHDNLTTINSQDEVDRHRNSVNDWTAPPDGDLTEDEHSFMSNPVEFRSATSPDIPQIKSDEDIDVDIDIVLSKRDDPVSEVDMSVSMSDHMIKPAEKKLGSNLLAALAKDTDSVTSGELMSEDGEIDVNIRRSSMSPATDTGLNSLGEISNIVDDEDDISLNLSSEEIGYIPTMPMSPIEPTAEEKQKKLKAELGFSFGADDEDVSATSHSATGDKSKASPESKKLSFDDTNDDIEIDGSLVISFSDELSTHSSSSHRKKELPSTPRTQNSEGSTPKASPKSGAYVMDDDDDDDTLSSITEKTEPVTSPELFSPEPFSPEPVTPLEFDEDTGTISDSISIKTSPYEAGDNKLSHGSESGRKSISPKADTPSDYRVTPNSPEVENSFSSRTSRRGSQGSDHSRNSQGSNSSSIASGIRSRSNSSKRSTPEVQEGSGSKSNSNSISVGVSKNKESLTTTPNPSASVNNSINDSQKDPPSKSAKLHFGSMMGGSDSDEDSDDTMHDKDDDVLNCSLNKSLKNDAEINNLSIVSQPKSSEIEKNIVTSARASPEKMIDSPRSLVSDVSNASKPHRKDPVVVEPSRSVSDKKKMFEVMIEKQSESYDHSSFDITDDISEDIIDSEMESDDEAEKLLAQTNDFLRMNTSTPLIKGTMDIDIDDPVDRVPAAKPNHPDIDVLSHKVDLNVSNDNNIIGLPDYPSKHTLAANDDFIEKEFAQTPSISPSPDHGDQQPEYSSDESEASEAGKLAKKYLKNKSKRESDTSPQNNSPRTRPTPCSSSNSNYVQSLSPVSGLADYIVESVPSSKQVTPRVSMGVAPAMLFSDAPPPGDDKTSTPIKPKEGDAGESSKAIGISPIRHSTEEFDPASEQLSASVLSAKFEEIEKRKQDAEQELQEIRRLRRSHSPVSLTESVVTDSQNLSVPAKPRGRAASGDSMSSLVSHEDLPIDGKHDLPILTPIPSTPGDATPSSRPGSMLQDHISDCASAISEAVSYIQTNMDIQSSPVTTQLHDQLKDAKKKLSKAMDSKAKSETLRKKLEIEVDDLRRKLDSNKTSKTSEDQSKMDMELELRSIKFKYDHEVEQKKNIEALLRSSRENLRGLETRHKAIVEDQQAAEIAKNQAIMDYQNAEQAQKLLEVEISEMRVLLDEEQRTRLIQEEMFNEQLNRSRDLSTEAQKSVRQKQDILHQLTEAEEVCRNAESRNQALAKDLNALKTTYESDKKTWADTEMELKTSMTTYDNKVRELEMQITSLSAKYEEKSDLLRKLEQTMATEKSEFIQVKHGLELKQTELVTENKQLTQSGSQLKIDLEKLTTELDLTKVELNEMHGKLKTAEEVGTASANEQINILNQKIGQTNSLLSSRLADNERIAKELRDTEEKVRHLEAENRKHLSFQKIKDESFTNEGETHLEAISNYDEQIQNLQLHIGELEEKLYQSDHKVEEVLKELDDAKIKLLEKSGEMLTQEDREQLKTRYVTNLEEQLQREREKGAKASTDYETTLCRLTRAEDENESMTHQITQLEERLEQRDESIYKVNDKLSATRTKLQQENDKSREELKRKNEALQDHISELRQSLVSAEAAKDMAEIEINRLKQEVKQQASSLRMKEDSFKQAKLTLENKSNDLSEDCRKAEKKLQELYTDRLHLKNDLSNTKEHLETEIAQRKELERKFEHLSMQNNTTMKEAADNKNTCEREIQNKVHYQELYKAEQEYCQTLKDEIADNKKNITSLESLNETLKNTVAEIKDHHREEKLGRSLASKDLQDTRQMLDNELKTRTHIGTQIANLERDNQDLTNSLHNEQKKLKKANAVRKTCEANVEALQQNLTDLHKDIGSYKLFRYR